MMFDQILETLKNNGKAGMAYSKVIALSERAIKNDPERAIAYLLLKVLAEQFIEATGRLPIKATQIEAAFENFSANLKMLRDAYAEQDATVIAIALNKVALGAV